MVDTSFLLTEPGVAYKVCETDLKIQFFSNKSLHIFLLSGPNAKSTKPCTMPSHMRPHPPHSHAPPARSDPVQ